MKKPTKVNFDDPNQVLTAQDIAEYLKLARQTIYELFDLPVSRGGIGNFPIGNSRRAMTSDLIKYIEAQRGQQDELAQRRLNYIEKGVRSIS